MSKGREYVVTKCPCGALYVGVPGGHLVGHFHIGKNEAQGIADRLNSKAADARLAPHAESDLPLIIAFIGIVIALIVGVIGAQTMKSINTQTETPWDFNETNGEITAPASRGSENRVVDRPCC